MDLSCRVAHTAGVPTLHVAGELDLATIGIFRDAAVRLVAGAAGATVVVDLDGVTVIDDAGLGVILGAAARARDAGGDLVLVCTSERHLRRFELTGLSRAVEVRHRIAPVSDGR